MSTIAETTLSATAWTSVATGTKAYIQCSDYRSVKWRLGSTTPAASSLVGHSLINGHPVLVETSSENLYARVTDSGKSVVVTVTDIT